MTTRRILNFPFRCAVQGAALAAGALALASNVQAQAAQQDPAPVGQESSSHTKGGKKMQDEQKTHPDEKGGTAATGTQRPATGKGATPGGKTQGGSDTRDSQQGGSTTGSTGHGGLPGSGASSGSGGTPDQR